ILRKPFDTLLKTPHANESIFTTMEGLKRLLAWFDENPFMFQDLAEQITTNFNNFLYLLMSEKINLSSLESAKCLYVIVAMFSPLYMDKLTVDKQAIIRKSLDNEPIYPPNPKMNQRFGGWFTRYDQSSILYFHDRLWRLCVALTVDQNYDQVADN